VNNEELTPEKIIKQKTLVNLCTIIYGFKFLLRLPHKLSFCLSALPSISLFLKSGSFFKMDGKIKKLIFGSDALKDT